MTVIGKFFIFCSGAERDILDTCPTDRTKYQGIGATIFFTAVLASISGGYAIYFVFNNISISIGFAILWGVIIFNLDRYIVVSMKKTGRFWEEARFAIPRILIATVLALVISKPLELRLFESRIAKQMGKNNQTDLRMFDDQYNKDIDNLNNQISKLNDDIIQRKLEIFNKDPEYNILNQNKNNSEGAIKVAQKDISKNEATIVRTRKPIYRYPNNVKTRIGWDYPAEARTAIKSNIELRKKIEEERKRLDDNDVAIKNAEKRLTGQVSKAIEETESSKSSLVMLISNKKANYPAEKSEKQQEIGNSTDLLARLEALGDLKKTANSVGGASLLVTLLFFLLETAPVFVKLLSKRGPYDEVLERREYEILIEQKHIISEINERITQKLEELVKMVKFEGDLRVRTQTDKLNVELKANTALLEKIAERQGQLADYAIEKWFREEEEKLKNDPQYNFVQSKSA
jgi:predicted RNA-binding protein Jag